MLSSCSAAFFFALRGGFLPAGKTSRKKELWATSTHIYLRSKNNQQENRFSTPSALFSYRPTGGFSPAGGTRSIKPSCKWNDRITATVVPSGQPEGCGNRKKCLAPAAEAHECAPRRKYYTFWSVVKAVVFFETFRCGGMPFAVRRSGKKSPPKALTRQILW